MMRFASPIFGTGLFLTAGATAQGSASIVCDGVAKQGGLLICEAPAGTRLTLEGARTRSVRASDEGRAAFGLRRDETSRVTVSASGAGLEPVTLDIAERNDDYREISGLDCDKVDARTDAQKAHASRSWVKKQDAFASFNDGPGASTGFQLPAEGPMSSPFGPVRKYYGTGANGETCEKVSVHQGYDQAVPVGTPVVAPAAGTVILGDPDLYYEGGSVFLDHGYGLTSVFMHMSEVDVEAGDTVEAGERLGASGNTGRTTGPHLHWAVKWRNRDSSDRGGDFYIDPALLLELERDLPDGTG